MKKILALITLTALLVLTLAGCGDKAPSDIPKGYQIASVSDCDYVLYVPDTWMVDNQTLYTSAYHSSGDPTSISVTAGGMNFEDKTVEDWWKGYEEQFSEAFDSYELLSTEDAKLGGVDGKKFTYTAKMADGQYNFICIAVVRNDYVYYMLYTSTPEKYEAPLETLDEVVSYFEFKD